jgi:1,4-alpha-glucan branching enzyme
MALLRVNFTFHTGLKHKRFFNVRLSGSWDATGRFSNQWSNVPMALSPDWTGCDAFTASVSLDDTQVGAVFQWGVIADIASAPNTWVVPTEVPDQNSTGDNVGNGGATLRVNGGQINAVIPAHGFVVLEKVS